MRQTVAAHVRTNAARYHRLEVAAHGLGLLLIAVLFYFAITAVGKADVNKCTSHVDLNASRGYLLAACTAGGFGVAYLVGWFRWRVREGLKSPGLAPPATGILLEVLLVLFLAAATVLLGYETWSVAHGGNPPPITSYVRCAAYYQLPVAAITTASIGFILSSWLWYPTK